MEALLKAFFSEFHNIAAVSSIVVSALGVLVAASKNFITAKYLVRQRKAIDEEAGRNFTYSESWSTSSPKSTTVDLEASATDMQAGWSATEGHNRSWSRGVSQGQNSSHTRGESENNFGRAHSGSWNYREVEPTAAERSTKIAKDQVRTRLTEAIEERERQASSAKWSRITSRVLTFGQYIIGALLTTSLAQNSMSKTWLSIFGLLVILCSATKQHFHVDESAQASAVKAQKLRALVRFVQDQIVILEARSVNGQDRTDAFIALLGEITSNLSQIETSETVFTPAAPIESNSKG